MEYGLILCENCGKNFLKKAFNSKYCGENCRKKAMNNKVLARYHDKKQEKKNIVGRVCSVKTCSNFLSIYNKDKICESCKVKRLEKRLKKFGWSIDDIKTMGNEID